MIFEEVKRSILNKKVLLLILFALIIQLYGSYSELKDYIFLDINAPDIDKEAAKEMIKSTVFNKHKVFFFAQKTYTLIMPIIAVIPAALNYYYDKKGGIIPFIHIRMKSEKYSLIKFLCNGIGGGIVVALPTILYYLLTTLFLRNVLDESGIQLQGIYQNIYPNNPFLAVLLLAGINFIFGFTYSTIALGVSSIIENAITILSIPIIYWYGGGYLFPRIGLGKYSPLYTSQTWGAEISVYSIMIHFAVLITIFAGIFFYMTRKEKIYG